MGCEASCEGHPQPDGHLMIIDEEPIKRRRDNILHATVCRVERRLGALVMIIIQSNLA